MKTLVVLAVVLAVVAAGPAPAPEPTPAAAADQESQASEAVSKRGAARLSAVSGNSIVDNTQTLVQPQPQPLQQLQQQQTIQLQAAPQQQPQQQQQQQPLFAPHPYSFVTPQPHGGYFQYQPTLLPQLPMLHSKYQQYQAPGKHVLQYVPQPYFQVPQFQAPLMYLFPQPAQHIQAHHQQPQQAQPHQAGQPSSQQGGSQTEQPGQQQQTVHHPQQPHYVMLLSAPVAPVAPVQYYNHPQLALPQTLAQPQQIFSYYQPPHHQLHHQQHQQHTRFYPEQQQPQQQVVYQSEGPSPQGDLPHFVPKNSQNPVGLEAPAPPLPSYGARVQQQQQQPQHAYKTIIKA